jgi:hypothetical protein
LSIFSNLHNKVQLWLLSRRKQAPAEQQAEKAEVTDALRKLVRQPEWNTYRRMLDITVSAQVQTLLAGGSDAEVHRLRGYIQGLLHSVQLAEQLVTQDDNARERKQRSNAADAGRLDSARTALYSTGLWGN